MAKKVRDKLYTSMFLNTVLTMAIIEFSQVGASFIDGIITSKNFGAEAIAAIGIIYPFFSFTGLFSGLLTAGTQTKCTSLLGEGKSNKVSSVLSFSLFCGLIVSAIFTIVCFIFPAGISTLLGARAEEATLLAFSKDYLKGLALGTIPLVLNPIIAMALTLEGKGSLVRVSSLLNAAINVVLDIIAVKTNMGIFGIGLATSLSGFVQFIIMLAPFIFKKSTYRFTIHGFDFKDLKEISYYGSEKIVRRLSKFLRPIVINNVAITIGGSLVISALSVNNSLLDFVMIPYAGISAAVGLLSGVFHGERNKNAIVGIGGLAHRTVGVATIVASGALLVLSGFISNFYSSGNELLYSYITFTVYCLAIDLPIRALIDSRMTYLQGIKKTKSTSLLSLTSRFFFPALCCVGLGYTLGVYGIIGSFFIADVLTLAAIFITAWIQNKKIQFGSDAYLQLEKNFDIAPENVIALTIRDEEDISLTSWQLQLFCQGHKFKGSSAMLASMCLEELLSLILKEQQNNKKQNAPIHVRVTIDGDEIIIRTRDSCDNFNFTQYLTDISSKINSDDQINNSIFKTIIKEVNFIKCINTNVYYMKIKM